MADMSKTFTADEVREMLRREVAKAGSLRKWARPYGVSAAYVSLVLRGECAPGPSVTVPLGLRREETVVWRLDNA